MKKFIVLIGLLALLSCQKESLEPNNPGTKMPVEPMSNSCAVVIGILFVTSQYSCDMYIITKRLNVVRQHLVPPGSPIYNIGDFYCPETQ